MFGFNTVFTWEKIANLHHFSAVGLVEGLSIVCHYGGCYNVKSLTVAT